MGENSNQQDKPLSPRQQALVDRLPEFNWCITQAALAVGYSPSYVDSDLVPRLKADPRFSTAVERKRQEIAQRTWSVEQWRAEVTDALRRCREKGDRATEHALLKMVGMHIGAFAADNHQRRPEIGMLIL